MDEGTVRWSQSARYRDMWLDPDDDPRETAAPAEAGTDERSILFDYLRRYRLTLELKCADLDAEQLARRSVPPSTMSLLGVVRHMTDVERTWFRRGMAGQDAPPHYWTDDAPDADWDDARADTAQVEQAWSAWRDEVAFAEDVAAKTELDARGLDSRTAALPFRDIVVHMIEEYARHCGHADLLRECVDGRIGQ